MTGSGAITGAGANTGGPGGEVSMVVQPVSADANATAISGRRAKGAGMLDVGLGFKRKDWVDDKNKRCRLQRRLDSGVFGLVLGREKD